MLSGMHAARPVRLTISVFSAQGCLNVSKRILFGVSSSWIRLVAVAAIQILLTPLLFSRLPAGELGVWYLFFTVATFITLADLGLPSAYGRAVSYIWAGSAPSAGPVDSASAYHGIPIGSLYRSANAATLLIGTLIALAGYIVAVAYFDRVIADGELRTRTAQALSLFLAGVVCNVASAIPFATLNGVGDVGWENVATIIVQAAGYILTLLLLPLYPDIRLLALLYVFQGVLQFLLGRLLLRKRHPGLLRQREPVRFDAMKRMFSDAAPVFITRIGAWFVLEINLVIAGYYLGAAAVPDYAVLRQLVMMGLGISNAIPIAASPYAATAHARGDASAVRNLYLKAVRYSLVVAGIWSAGLLLWTPEVMDLWIGKGHFLGYSVLIPLVIGIFLEQQHSAHSFFTWSAGRWPFAPWAMAGGVLNVILASLGCRLYGYEGLVWGTVIAQVLTNNWYGVYYPLRHLGVSLTTYMKRTALPLLLFILILLIAGIAIKASCNAVFTEEKSAGRRHLVERASSGIFLTGGAAIALAWLIFFRGTEGSADIRALLHREPMR